jgi:hypothetical protein
MSKATPAESGTTVCLENDFGIRLGAQDTTPVAVFQGTPHAIDPEAIS